jgi:PAS domain S-box-containing protein
LKQNKTLPCNILFDGSQPMLLVDSTSLIIKHANLAAVSFWGYPQETMESKNLSELIVSDTSHIISDADCLSWLPILKCDGSIVKKHITHFPVEFSDNHYVCILVSTSGGVHQNETEDICKNSDFKLLFKKNPFPGIVYNRKTRKILFVNEAASELYGFTQTEFLSKKVDDIVIKDETLNSLEDAVSLIPGRYYRTIANHQTKDNNILNVEVHTWPYEMANKYTAISFIKNKTNEIPSKPACEKKDFNSDHNIKRYFLNNSDEFSTLKTIILSNLSHELRTPLVGILGYSDILKSEIVNSEMKQMAEVIHASGEKLLTDLNMILNLSAIEIGKAELFFKETDLCIIILKIIKKMQPSAEKKKIYLRFSSPYRELKVLTDSELIYDTLYYIIDNAIKFTNSGGVTIDLGFTYEQNKPYYKIQVIDTGIGITDEQQKVIFDAFRQINEGTNRIFGGLGIGLTVAKKIISMLGGEITFSSVLAEGSSFTLFLPIEN